MDRFSLDWWLSVLVACELRYEKYHNDDMDQARRYIWLSDWIRERIVNKYEGKQL